MYTTTLTITTEKEFTDITDKIQEIISNGPIDNGKVMIESLHTTCGIKIMEDEPLSFSDVDEYLEKRAPIHGRYAHDKIHLRDVPLDERVNGYSHVRMLSFQTELTRTFQNKKITLGKWQSIILAEMDFGNPSVNNIDQRRIRTVVVTIE